MNEYSDFPKDAQRFFKDKIHALSNAISHESEPEKITKLKLELAYAEADWKRYTELCEKINSISIPKQEQKKDITYCKKHFWLLWLKPYNQKHIRKSLDYKNFCTQILGSDDKVRGATVYDEWGTVVAGGMREGVENILSDQMEKELVNISVLDWKARKEMSKTLGKTTYTLADSEKLKLFSFYLGDENLLLLSAEPESNTKDIVDRVIEIYHKIK